MLDKIEALGLDEQTFVIFTSDNGPWFGGSTAGLRGMKGKTWEGIAGKFSPRGRFSVGGSKETAYAVYAALADRSSDGYDRVRTAAAA